MDTLNRIPIESQGRFVQEAALLIHFFAYPQVTCEDIFLGALNQKRRLKVKYPENSYENRTDRV